MGSFHDAFAERFGEPLLRQQFAERDKNGEIGKILYRGPGIGDGVEPLKLTATLSPIRFADVVSEIGVERRESRTALVPTAELTAGKVTGFERGARVSINGEIWMLDETETKFEAVMTTLGLVRQPLVRGWEASRAAV